MILWQFFRRDEIDILFHLCGNRFSTLFKRCEPPLAHLVLQSRPELQHFGVAASVGIYNVACGRHGQREVKLIESGAHALKRNCATMRFDLMRAGYIVVNRRMRWLFLV
jgi:hypothetical protein